MSDPIGTIDISHCARVFGGSVRECPCMLLPHDRLGGGGFLSCPPEARGPLPPRKSPKFSGDSCQTCGSMQMVRTGTCLTCQCCGDSSGGCS